MAALTEYSCSNCGFSSPKWQGQCPACSQWNTLEETVLLKPAKKAGGVDSRMSSRVAAKPMLIQDIPDSAQTTYPTQIGELDRVLGTGFVQGSVVLLGGEPGIGKSTLSLQLAQSMALQHKTTLYVSGEESASQIRLRSNRVSSQPAPLYVLSEVNIVSIMAQIQDIKPDMIVLDSIQVVFHPELPSIPGSINQIRHCANELIQLVKEKGLMLVIIGHITKDGHIAGPKVLEHMVDVILYLEGERNQQFRLLRCFKNRYSHTGEIGIFKMDQTGLLGISSPSELFIDTTSLETPGSVVSPVMEGSRVILVEVQALVVNSGYGMAKRTFLGVDANRANVMISAIEKLCGVPLGNQDIILNIIGGLKITQPSLDLAIVTAILSSYKNIPLNRKIGVMGEVGLTGEIRPISNVKQRLNELIQMGFTECILPLKNKLDPVSDGGASSVKGIRCIYVQSIHDIVTFYKG